MRKTIVHFAIIIFLSAGLLQSLQSQEPRKNNIVEELSNPDSATNAAVHIYQDQRIEQLITTYRAPAGPRPTVAGYRVQVFSSNIQRTAKNEAYKVERQIRDVYPDEGIYVNYLSPFWKVRVGDFRTQAQAIAFRTKLIKEFPEFRSETYIVREQVYITPVTSNK